MEAVIAAMYLDGGYAAAETCVLSHWDEHVDDVELTDPKSQLQEWLQAQGEKLPTYVEVNREGTGENTWFTMEVRTQNHGSAQGEGKSKQKAGRHAATRLIEKLEI